MPLSAMLKSAPALGLMLTLAAAPQTLAQDKTIELKLSHWVPPTHPLQKSMEEWGADVEKASGGTIKYKVYPSQQLGKAFDHYDMARDGIADVKTGDKVRVLGVVQGSSTKALDIADVTNIREHHEKWAPKPPAAPEGGAPGGATPSVFFD